MRQCLSQWKLFLIGAGTAASIVALSTATPAEARRATHQHRIQGTTQAGTRVSSHRAARHHRGMRTRTVAVRERTERHHHAAPAAAYAAVDYAAVAQRRTVIDREALGDRYVTAYPEMTEQRTALRGRRATARVTSRDMASVGPDAGHTMASAGGSSVVSEARRWLGTNPTNRRSLWCGTFMNFVLERTGHRGTGSNLARSFAGLGQRVSGPQVGAIAVMARRGGGHVGVVSGIDAKGNPIIISGNHGRRVAETVYPRGRIYAYVMP